MVQIGSNSPAAGRRAAPTRDVSIARILVAFDCRIVASLVANVKKRGKDLVALPLAVCRKASVMVGWDEKQSF
jgi:hypothetical protein